MTLKLIELDRSYSDETTTNLQVAEIGLAYAIAHGYAEEAPELCGWMLGIQRLKRYHQTGELPDWSNRSIEQDPVTLRAACALFVGQSKPDTVQFPCVRSLSLALGQLETERTLAELADSTADWDDGYVGYVGDPVWDDYE